MNIGESICVSVLIVTAGVAAILLGRGCQQTVMAEDAKKDQMCIERGGSMFYGACLYNTGTK